MYAWSSSGINGLRMLHCNYFTIYLAGKFRMPPPLIRMGCFFQPNVRTFIELPDQGLPKFKALATGHCTSKARQYIQRAIIYYSRAFALRNIFHLLHKFI